MSVRLAEFLFILVGALGGWLYLIDVISDLVTEAWRNWKDIP